MEKLGQEYKVLSQHLNEWRISHLGEFVLIKKNLLIGFFPSLDSAFDEGLKRFGIEDFLVEKITPEETVNVSFYGRPA